MDELIDKFGGPDKVSEVNTQLESLVSNKLKSEFLQSLESLANLKF